MGQQRIRQLQRQAATPTAAPPAQKPFSWQRPFPVPAPDTATAAPQPIPDLQARLEILRQANPDWSKVKASSTPAKAVQAKLTVGASNDQYEQEADRVADQVMSMPDAATQPPVQREGKHEEDELQTKPLAATITPLVQREAIPEEEDPVQKKASGNADIQREEMPEEEEVLTKPLSSGALQRNEMAAEEDDLQMKSLGTADLQRETRPEDDKSLQTKPSPTPDSPLPTPGSLETQLSNTQSSGSPLPNDVRSFMEPRFGADFSQVRVHTGSDAVQMNRDLNAQAFTHKQDVYFGVGKTPGKDALTAHELTHVVQQSSSNQLKCTSCQEEDKKIQMIRIDSPQLQRKWNGDKWDYEYDGCTVPESVSSKMKKWLGRDKDNPAGGVDTSFGNPNLSSDDEPVLPCDKHDKCYQTCYSKPGGELATEKDRTKCDDELLNQMLSVCKKTVEDKGVRNQCVDFAHSYFMAVSAGSEDAFYKRQANACHNLPETIKAVKSYLTGWVSDDDINNIEWLCSDLSRTDRASVYAAVLSKIKILVSFEQRARVRRILGA